MEHFSDPGWQFLGYGCLFETFLGAKVFGSPFADLIWGQNLHNRSFLVTFCRLEFVS